MSLVTIDVGDMRRIERAIKAAEPELYNALREANWQSAGEVAKLAKRLIRAGGARRRRAGSQPGEPPVGRTGRLVRSIRRRRIRRSLAARVTADAFYSLHVEAGHRQRRFTYAASARRNRHGFRKRVYTEHGRVEPRPFLIKAAADLQGDHFARIENALGAASRFLTDLDAA